MKNLKKSLLLLFVFSALLNATSYKKTDLSSLIGNSSLIVEGTVINSESRWSGKKIITSVAVDISKIHKGSYGKNIIKIILLGGRVGGSEMIVHGSPEFKINEKVFLLLVWHRGVYWLNSMGMGKFNVLTENGVVFLENKNVSIELLTAKSFKSKVVGYPKYLYSELTDLITKGD